MAVPLLPEKKRMNSISRREFLEAAFCLSLTALLPRISAGRSTHDGREFQLLVVGDSLIWGQGLDEADKSYSLVKNWLETEAFGGTRKIKLKNKSHSGSTIKLHPNEDEALRKAGREETDGYEPEVNVGFPSIWKQVETAAGEYERDGVGGADLVLLTASITDISVRGILDPFGKDDELRSEIKKYSYDHTSDLLEHISARFPASAIAVIGYYPMISPKTPASKLFNVWLESSGFPRFLKPVANNVLTRQFFRSVRKKALKRSRIWASESDRHLQAAVDRFNSNAGRKRAVFVRSPITEDTTYETRNTQLFRMVRKGRSDDALYDSRVKLCRAALPDLKRTTGLKYSVRSCEIAAIGHPNIAGSRAIAESIKRSVAPLLAANYRP